ncbi:hypothetical protein ACFWY9_19630 [Amycolatopsis sp. NPDC059027]|uniref:hypothetical protein n=1 Tax=Amycolatopsis sp. NPDC059027 TaxID=3346709 RepID=UPI003672E6B7
MDASEQRVAALAAELERVQREADRYRSLQALLDEILNDLGMSSGADDPVGASGEAGQARPDTDRPFTAAEASHKTRRDDADNEAPIEDVYQVVKARAGEVVTTRDVLAEFPGATRVQISDRLGRLKRQGKITGVSKGKFRFDPPAVPAPVRATSPAQERHDREEGAPRERIGLLLNLKPHQGWLPEEMAAAISHANPDFVRALMQDMAHCGEAVADGAGRYWPPRPSAVVTALTAADDRQVGMA